MESGRKLGPYEIVEPLGAGGMGEVYRARDPRLDRDVAIKVLPAGVASEPERLARFDREAKLLAQLHHPNIAGIYGLEQSEGTRFIAMECVDGANLAERIEAAGSLEIDDALAVARQIAEALEAAHEAGIIHRDLKPANVKTTAGGQVKVLDFGLAKAFDADGAASGISPEISHSPTMAAATQTGVIVGTAAYMSPEQARGRPVDKRSDIWAFGCLLFEMLTGRPVFVGETVTDILAAVVTREPDWSKLPASTPAPVRRLIERCLERDERMRLRDIGEARVLLTGDLRETATRGSGTTARSLGFASLARTAGVAVVTAILGFAAGSQLRVAPVPVVSSPRQLPVATLDGARFERTYWPSLAITPDGGTIAYVVSTGLHLQDLRRGTVRRIPDTETASAPFFSPDGRTLAYFLDESLWRVHVDGGDPTEIVATGWGHPGGDWIADGSILYLPHYESGHFSVVDTAGARHELAPIDGAWNLFYPDVLPGGRRVLVSANELGGVHVLDLDDKTAQIVESSAYFPRYVPPGYLLFMRNYDLMAATFDLGSLEVGEPVIVATNVAADPGEVFGEYAVSDSGDLVYLQGAPGGEWLHLLRPGAEPEVLNSRRLAMDYIELAVSADGGRVAYSSEDGDVWTYDLQRDVVTRVTQTADEFEFQPVWHPDGRHVTAIVTSEGGRQLRQIDVVTGAASVLFDAGARNAWPLEWVADGSGLIIGLDNPETGIDLLLLGAAGGEPSPLVSSPARDHYGSLSPDGRWLVYESDETGEPEVYLRSVPDGARQVVSTGGGGYPTFVAEATAILYSRGATVYRAAFDVRTGRPGEPEVFVTGVDTHSWDALPDGSAVVTIERRPAPELRVILDAVSLFER